LVIRVADTGIGIAKENYESIFEPFRQESEGIGRSFEGTGLGLSITKKFVEMMKGSIEVDSEVGIGSTFTVKFPLVDNDDINVIESINEKPGKENAEFISSKNKDLSILLVENDLDNLKFTASVLSNHYKTDIAMNGYESVKIAKDKTYDIILMDINLGKGIDGLMATKEIRKIKGYEKTPIVALTAYVREGDKEEFLAGGCTHFLGKPFSTKQLLDLIEKI
jgi:CheY-like chemotaxis protein